jgi:hypothetical protein
MSSEKRVQRTTKDGAPTASFHRTEPTTDAETADAEVTDQVDPPDMPAVYGTSAGAKRQWAKLLEYFKPPIKAKSASTPGVPHIRTVREAAFDNDPVDYRTRLAKVRGRRGDK